MWRSRTVPLLVAFGLLASACGSPAFTRADGIDFVSPLADVAVAQPLTLDWEVDADLQARIDAGEVILGVFVDRTPLAPGQNLLDLADDDCRREEGCPDAAWLADRGVFATKGSALELSALSDRRTSESETAPDRHEAIVVLLDAGGTRIGEDYWSTHFLVDRGGR